jgi:hypothetical protein
MEDRSSSYWQWFYAPQGLKGSARRFNVGNLPSRGRALTRHMKCAFEEKHPVRRVGDAVGGPEGAEIRTVVSCLSASGEQKRRLMRPITEPQIPLTTDYRQLPTDWMFPRR